MHESSKKIYFYILFLLFWIEGIKQRDKEKINERPNKINLFKKYSFE